MPLKKTPQEDPNLDMNRVSGKTSLRKQIQTVHGMGEVSRLEKASRDGQQGAWLGLDPRLDWA